jgi:hypothetical protein
MKNSEILKIDYILAARQVNLSKSSIYLWTLVYPEVVKCVFNGGNVVTNNLKQLQILFLFENCENQV